MYLLTSIIWQQKYKALSTLEQEVTLQGRDRIGDVKGKGTVHPITGLMA
jgi:hypothetical protein